MSPSPGGIIYAADIQQALDASDLRPRVKLLAQSAQSLADNTDTAATFGAGSTDVDTHGLHSESVNTSRITFDRDGTWLLRSTLAMAAVTSQTFVQLGLAFFKNGTVQTVRIRPSGANITGVITSVQGQCEMEALAGDYAEVYWSQRCSSAASRNTVGSSSFGNTFEAIYQRAHS